jgi:hypothetical protein
MSLSRTMEQVASGVEALGIVTIVVGLAVALVQAARLQFGGDGRASAYRAAVLGLIVLIRTLLSFSLEVEIDGTWPWRRAVGRAGTVPRDRE